MNLNQRFAERLNGLMQDRHMKIAELCRRIGVTRMSVYAWIGAKKMPSAKSLAMIADVLETSTDYLLGRKSYL